MFEGFELSRVRVGDNVELRHPDVDAMEVETTPTWSGRSATRALHDFRRR